MDATAPHIVELRRYALQPGARETLIELFDGELVEPQEAVGMAVLGQFRDVDDADSFVWLRGFPDMPGRKRALETFYGGPVWKEHARAANATMIDSDNVLLLRRLSGLELEPGGRPAPGGTAGPSGLLAITTYPLAAPASSGFPEVFAREVEPALREAGITLLATCATEHSENTFPALPVREGEDVFVWMALFADEDDHARRVAELERSPAWEDGVAPALAERLDGEPEIMRLTPTSRSLIHG
jgi:NIPSNAP